MMKKWIHKSVIIKSTLHGIGDKESNDSVLQKHGQEGWELVCVTQNLFFFKKEEPTDLVKELEAELDKKEQEISNLDAEIRSIIDQS